MKLASWNIKGNNGVSPTRRAALITALNAVDADVVVLQEVAWKGGLHEDLMRRLAACGWGSAAYGGVVGSGTKRYGNLIASRYPLEHDESDWAPGVPWRQSLLRVTVDAPSGRCAVVGAHIPNGSGNGWRKIETFEALARALAPREGALPVLVAGDFNEPREVSADGTVIPFAMTKRRDGQWSAEGVKRGKCGRTFPRQRWVDGVRAILGQQPRVDLTHAARATGGPAAWHVTHEVRGAGRFFDHILVSSHWSVLATGVEGGVLHDGTSDHALVWAEVQPRR